MEEGGAKEESPSAPEATAPEAAAEPPPPPPPPPEPEPQPSGAAESEPAPPPDATKMVKTVGSLTDFQAELAGASGKLIVVDFSATWCGPCKMIKPFFHSLVEKYPDVLFIEIDVDDAQDVAAHCDVKCMPTFQFYKNNEKVHEFSGANKEKLEETIKKLK